ncbi:YwqI/YxiC family protein [Amphibacillus sp. MSJ-3]|uniref:DUF5344 family protein n=1 Tax=Amphibacillus sp. MSJ-3 TaxID=2841505 RepID=UPI001C0ED278|nr:DUF5344 family protein [Amphibacillus sp. MSJ-3]MBU5594935.1 YwqI/YxiC family protein [Amphibacillus sp. MSJ-3]
MVTIQLNHQHVIAKIEQAKSQIDSFKIKIPPQVKQSDNHLNFVNDFRDREVEINQLVNTYLEVVMKNLEDTKANVNLIQQQDHAIIR